MEYPSKRRRIVNKAEPINGGSLPGVASQPASFVETSIKDGPGIWRLVSPFSQGASSQVKVTDTQDTEPSFESTDTKPPQTESQQGIPCHAATAFNNAIGHVKALLMTSLTIAEKGDRVGVVKRLAKREAFTTAPTTTNDLHHPNLDGSLKLDISRPKVSPATDDKPTSPGSPIAKPGTSNPVNADPGLVTPLPAEAAASARNKALQTQEALAQKYNIAITHSTGDSTPSGVETQKGQSTPYAGLNNGIDESTQHILETPSTPLPSSIEPSSNSASYFSTSPPALSTSAGYSPDQSSLGPGKSSLATSHMNDVDRLSSQNSTVLASSISESIGSSFRSTIKSATATSDSSRTTSALREIATSHLDSTASVPVRMTPTASMALSRHPTKEPLPFSATTFTTKLFSSSASSSSISSISSIILQSSSQQPSSGSLSSSASSSSSSGIVGNGNNGNAISTRPPISTPTTTGGGAKAPPTPILVGGIVGGLAGLAMILLALLFLFRLRRGKVGQRRLISPPMVQTPVTATARGSGSGTQRSSNVPIAAAGFFGRLRPSSSQTAATTDTAPSERGFQKISGRKLESVLHSGGDGYGNTYSGISGGTSTSAARGVAPGQGPYAGLAPGLRPSPPQSLSGSSFYRDSRGFYGGVVPKDETSSDPTESSVSPSSSSPPPLGVLRSPHAPSRGSEVPNIRPGPARQPVINEPGFFPVRTPSRAQAPPRPVRETPPSIMEHSNDSLGRSHPGGSRESRFRESNP